MKIEQQACCPHCGTMMFVRAEQDAGEKELARLAEEQCKCEGSAVVKKIRNTEEAAKLLLCGDDCKAAGFRPVTDNTYAAILEIVGYIARGAIDSARIEEPGGDTITLKNGKGGIGVKRERRITREV